jgi:RNA polymerase primary sigma factor
MNYNETNFSDLTKYCGTLNKGRGLPREKERELALKIQAGDNKALNELVEANLKYVVTVAKKFAWTGLPLYDLISEGNLGLIKAAKKFDPDRGTKFITCARPWITQAIQTYVQSNNIDKEMTNIDDYVFDEETSSEMINEDFEDEIHNIQSRSNAINELLSCLTKREYRVLEAYFGLNNAQEMTLDEIGEEMGLTQERVRQIKDESIEKLQFKAMSNNSYAEFKELY